MKVQVHSSLVTKRLTDGRRELVQALIVQVGATVYTVPKGFKTDYSSFPWLARLIVVWDKVDIAGVLHDYLYQTGQTTRKEADDIWRVVSHSGEHSANRFQSRLSWIGLRLGGWFTWHNYRKAEQYNDFY